MSPSLATLIIIPTYNEATTLPKLLINIFKTLPAAHILIVDDNSQDGTQDWVKAQMAHSPSQIHLLERPKKMGLGTAYIAGFQWALQRSYEVIFEMDADGSHQPKHLINMLKAINDGADVVIGSRYVPWGKTENWPWYRRCLSFFGNCYAKWVLKTPINDVTGGFKAFRKHVLASIDWQSIQSNGYAFQIEVNHLVHQKGFKIQEAPITFIERQQGKSKMSFAITLEALWVVWCFKFKKY